MPCITKYLTRSLKATLLTALLDSKDSDTQSQSGMLKEERLNTPRESYKEPQERQTKEENRRTLRKTMAQSNSHTQEILMAIQILEISTPIIL